MTLRALLALAIMAPVACLAQSQGTVRLYGQTTTTGAPSLDPFILQNAINQSLTAKVNTVGGTLTNPTITGGRFTSSTFVGSNFPGSVLASPTITGGTATGLALSGGTQSGLAITGSTIDPTSVVNVLPPSALTTQTLSGLFGQTYVVPDWFKISADGTDDMPSIVRAQATGLPLHFECRHYNIKSPSTIITLAIWKGCGWRESGTLLTGTWFDMDASFESASGLGNAGLAPFTFSGTAAAGSVIDGFAVSQPQPPVVPGTTVWFPNNYGFVFSAANLNGKMQFKNIFLYGITKGFSLVASGRTELDHISGQVFQNLATVDQSGDVSKFTDIHLFPYWADATQVEQYQQLELDTLILGRTDTTMIDRFFTIFAHSGIKLIGTASGTTTGAHFGMIQCDSVQFCIFNDITSVVASFQADMVRSFGQAMNRAPQFGSASISGTTMTVTAIGDGYYAVGDVITAGTGGSGAPSAGTTITALGTGTGGTGTYTVNNSQTMANRTIVATAPVVMLTNSAVLWNDGVLDMAQIGSLVDFGSDLTTILCDDVGNGSTIYIGSIYVANVQFSRPGAALVLASNVTGAGPVHTVNFGSPPQFTGTKPAGYTFKMSGSNSVVQAPTMAALTP